MVDFPAKQDIGVSEITLCELHLALGLDPIGEHVYLMCIGEEQKCIDSRQDGQLQGEHIDVTYFHVFQLVDGFPFTLFEWFKSCGITTSTAKALVIQMGSLLEKLLFEGVRGG